MFGNNEFIGLALEEDYVKYAHIEVDGDVIRVLGVDRLSLTDKPEQKFGGPEAAGSAGDEEAVFGLEEEESGKEEEELDLDEDLMEEETEEEDLMDLSVEEGEEGGSNAVQLTDMLRSLNPDRVDLGLNVPAGQTIIQVLKERDYEEVKKKELKQIIEDKLSSMYDTPKTAEFYAYEIREDGALILASIEDYAPLLSDIDEARELYDGKLFVNDVVADESALVGLVRSNYTFEETEITAIIQFEESHCRVVFMKGDQIWGVSPMINEGTSSDTFLNTVFSKLLYQLDTGEVPNLDRILLANNSLGQEAVDFFKENFPDLTVSNIKYRPDRFDAGDYDKEVIHSFTTAIAVAWSISGLDEDQFPGLTFLPEYVSERQKVFKLQWHGVVLLLLIGLTPIIFNYFYKANRQQIDQLKSQIASTERQISQLQQTVNAVNELSQNFAQLQQNLTMVDTLMTNSRKWTTTLEMINQKVHQVNSLWLTSLNTVGNGLRIEGKSLYRNRITQFIEVFHHAILDKVNLTTLRDRDIYQFTITVRSIVKNREQFAPQQSKQINEIIGNL